MVSYLRGLLSETERKNGWTLAEAAGETGPQGMQRLLNHYLWNANALRDDVRDAVVEHIGDPVRGVLILDETGFLKKGGPVGGGGPAVLGDCRTDREFPDRGVPGLRIRPGEGVDRPGAVPAQGLDIGS